MIPLPAQRLAQPAICGGVSRVQLNGAPKLSGGRAHVSLLAFGQTQVVVRGGVAGLDRQCFPIIFDGVGPILTARAIEARLAILFGLAAGRGQHQKQEIARRSHYQMNFALTCPMRGARAVVTSPNWLLL